MKQSEAAALTAKLLAAFPFHKDTDELTATVYIQQISRLKDPAVALIAIDDLISFETFFPPVGKITAAYRSALARQPKQAALTEGQLTEEQRKYNLEQVRAIIANLTKPMPE